MKAMARLQVTWPDSVLTDKALPPRPLKGGFSNTTSHFPNSSLNLLEAFVERSFKKSQLEQAEIRSSVANFDEHAKSISLPKVKQSGHRERAAISRSP
jgi:hypothetical protein